ncbi:hypothetical protein [Bacillus salipaludis]|uniref:hypothetical protein n=1 Tax=Bacillus salipaludis TaxID=2547811 RepID=UPI002E1CE84A|nr:hypothetical protein [Bacillus salipaludis]
MKKKFGIDIDGTVTSPSALLPFINKDFGLNLHLSDINQYDLTPFVNVPEEEFSKWFSENEPKIYEESPLSDGADDILNMWKDQHQLYFISARGPHLLENTKNWFRKKGLTYHNIDLIGSHDKVETVKKHRVDIFFEDKHDNAVMIHEECHIPVILFNTPYNQDPIPSGVVRVNNWFEAFKWVERWLKTNHEEKKAILTSV